uniref:Uncharacterized protein n=1 Tax=Anguilla anguilla TaxID=7936 RepID=A0A0E9Q2X5_ANGAN
MSDHDFLNPLSTLLHNPVEEDGH